ncbi:Hypothetical predicted protein [Marmota monax]|uniref:Uncharacterized protein n=1 Tax=Marmota monax TaxID=9995 RepID=A0A5E4A6M7_MARMO|nr:Hypothetical predicted protein [Marmota monax]
MVTHVVSMTYVPSMSGDVRESETGILVPGNVCCRVPGHSRVRENTETFCQGLLEGAEPLLLQPGLVPLVPHSFLIPMLLALFLLFWAQRREVQTLGWESPPSLTPWALMMLTFASYGCTQGNGFLWLPETLAG